MHSISNSRIGLRRLRAGCRRHLGQRRHPRLERAKFRVERRLPAPDKRNVQKNHRKDDAVGGEQVSQIFHQLDSIACLSDTSADANAILTASAPIRLRVRSCATLTISSHAHSAVNAASDTSSVATIRGSSSPCPPCLVTSTAG